MRKNKCVVCKGKGRVFWNSWIECKNCNGKGYIVGNKELKK